MWAPNHVAPADQSSRPWLRSTAARRCARAFGHANKPVRIIKLNRERAICPYCKQSVKSNVGLCSECRTIHHSECWTQYGGCSIYGCAGSLQQVMVRSSQRGWRWALQSVLYLTGVLLFIIGGTLMISKVLRLELPGQLVTYTVLTMTMLTAVVLSQRSYNTCIGCGAELKPDKQGMYLCPACGIRVKHRE